MVVQGKVENGRIVLPDDVVLPEGTTVSVQVPDVDDENPPTSKAPRTLRERLGPVIGAAENLPPDASDNVDHYLYGHPKRK